MAKRAPFHMVIDLETVADPELPPKDDEKKKFPAPVHHKIVCAGYAFLKSHRVVDWGAITDDEPEILRRISSALDTVDPTIVGMNSRGFDMPVIAARCLVHGIPLPWYYRTKLPRYRYSQERHLDLIDFLSDMGAAPKSSLDVWARAIGFAGKQGTDGTMVQAMHDAGELAAIADYCMGDVAQTCALFLRAELLRGALQPYAYMGHALALLSHCQADIRTAGLAASVDRKKFLLFEDEPAEERQAAE